MRINLKTAIALLSLSVFVSCSSANLSPDADASPAADQIARGQQLYSTNCALCHGASGEGTAQVPALVGKGALPLVRESARFRTGEFKTALDIAKFAVQNMPPGKDRLPEADYWAILAFALHANGVKLDTPVGPDNAASIVINK